MTHTFSVSSPISGVGIGLRSPHVAEVLNSQPAIPWLELLADNYLAEGGFIPQQLEAIADSYPLTLHCVGLSIASTEPFNKEYCQRIKQLAEGVNAAWISDHCCFTSLAGHYSHDLLPIPFNNKTLQHCVQRVDEIQQFFGQHILLENISSYMHFVSTNMQEVEFMCELLEKADCLLLMDVNNLYVNQQNQGIDALSYIRALPHQRIREIHLAGFQQQQNFILDAHNSPVAEPVWDLFRQLIEYCPQAPVLIEWDNDIPSLDTLLNEADKAQHILQSDA